jgi:hypothetical protein
MRLRPPRCWKRIGMRTTRVLPSSRASTLLIIPLSPLVALPEFRDEARRPLGPDPHLERVLLHIDPLDEELDDPRLLGGRSLSGHSGGLAKARPRALLSGTPKRLTRATWVLRGQGEAFRDARQVREPQCDPDVVAGYWIVCC